MKKRKLNELCTCVWCSIMEQEGRVLALGGGPGWGPGDDVVGGGGTGWVRGVQLPKTNKGKHFALGTQKQRVNFYVLSSFHIG